MPLLSSTTLRALRLGTIGTFRGRVVAVTTLDCRDLLVLQRHLVDKLLLLRERQLASVELFGEVNVLADWVVIARTAHAPLPPSRLPS